jgi:hypothetical protein
VVSGAASFLKSKTLDNDELKDALGGGVAGVAGFAGNLWGKAKEGVKAKLGKEAPGSSQTFDGHGMAGDDGVCWHSSGLPDRRASAPASSVSRDDDWESLFRKPGQAQPGPTPSTTASEEDEPVKSFKVSAPAKPGAPARTTSAPMAPVAPVAQAAPAPAPAPLQRKSSAPTPTASATPKKKEPAKLASSDDFFAEFGV